MGTQGSRALILDAGFMIALERRDDRAVHLLEAAHEGGDPLVIPAGVLGQVWRDGSRQASLAVLIGHRQTTVDPLDEQRAKVVGGLCGLTKTSDVVDASVVVAAREHAPAVVVTADPDDLRRIDPTLELHSL